MLTPATLSIWLKEQALPIGILLGLAALSFLILKISSARRHSKLSRARAGVTEHTFAEHLAQYNFDPVISGTTYRYLQQVQGVQFPILPSDDLDEVLGLDQDDIEQTIHDLLLALKREQTPGLRYEPILNVEGLVRHLQASPRIRKENAA